MDQPYMAPEEEDSFPPSNMPGENRKNGPGGGPGQDWRHMEGPKVPLMELFSYVRNSKFAMLKAALDYLPSKKFDKSLVQAAYIPQNGTVYVDGYERLAYHINKVDDYGNSLLSVSCQNSNAQICKYLVAKGANANHQNVAGQTPAHFAIAFKSFELSQWLFENGGIDTIENNYGYVYIYMVIHVHCYVNIYAVI
jgi:hypothetical protein